jgi:hypothetical protein
VTRLKVLFVGFSGVVMISITQFIGKKKYVHHILNFKKSLVSKTIDDLMRHYWRNRFGDVLKLEFSYRSGS